MMGGCGASGSGAGIRFCNRVWLRFLGWNLSDLASDPTHREDAGAAPQSCNFRQDRQPPTKESAPRDPQQDVLHGVLGPGERDVIAVANAFTS
jgi:hypothetical protein